MWQDSITRDSSSPKRRQDPEQETEPSTEVPYWREQDTRDPDCRAQLHIPKEGTSLSWKVLAADSYTPGTLTEVRDREGSTETVITNERVNTTHKVQMEHNAVMRALPD